MAKRSEDLQCSKCGLQMIFGGSNWYHVNPDGGKSIWPGACGAAAGAIGRNVMSEKELHEMRLKWAEDDVTEAESNLREAKQKLAELQKESL